MVVRSRDDGNSASNSSTTRSDPAWPTSHSCAIAMRTLGNASPWTGGRYALLRMARRGLTVCVAVAAALGLFVPGSRSLPEGASGPSESAAPVRPLRVLSSNPRYFGDGSGRAIYLTGSHVWWSLIGGRTWRVDCKRGSVYQFDYDAYLRGLTSHGHNFFRLWAIQHSAWRECGRLVRVGPLPWLRTGPGRALDGRPRFDLRRFDPAYFRRLRARVRAAGARGIYVSVMLFDGWSLQHAAGWRWRSHPFNRRNNVNGIDGDLNHDGTGTEIQTLRQPAVTRIQDRYVRTVVETVGDLDNVLYEVANEAGDYSTAWQYHMLRLVKRYESRRGKRHPVGMTFQHAGGSNAALYRSPADWISPWGDTYLANPRTANGRKVVIADTDHICGLCVDPAFPWKAFVRGNNVLFMDEFLATAESRAMRSAMGQARSYARRMNLAASRPEGGLSSTGYCLADLGREYLVYQPASGDFELDLRQASGSFEAEWFDPSRSRTIAVEAVTGGSMRRFTPPFAGPAILYLRKAA
jgi:uncharacterized protein DUF6298/collagenase-like protein with putative collagen-binding domain